MVARCPGAVVDWRSREDPNPGHRFYSGDSCNSVSYGLVTFSTTTARASAASSNHTIVAMVGDDIRLTRCTTCETEHPFKGGKAPRLRKKKTSVQAAYDEVLDSVKQDTQPASSREPDGSRPNPPPSDDTRRPRRSTATTATRRRRPKKSVCIGR